VFAVVYDVCLIAVMIGMEVLGHTASALSPTARAAQAPKQPTIDITPAVLDAEEEPEPAEQPITLSPKPRLASEEKSCSRGVPQARQKCCSDSTNSRAVRGFSPLDA
jgi:hypothetical protein